MKLTVVGYWGGYPAANGATSSYLLEKDGFAILLDAGSGSLSKVQQYKHVLDLDAVVLSHYHHDHVADIGVLQFAWLVESYVRNHKSMLPIYGHAEDQEGFQSLTHEFTKGIAYDPARELDIGPFRFTFFRTEHPVPCYGMRITDGRQVIVYTADSAFKETWYDFARNADLLITDCNFYAGQNSKEAGHMTSEEAASIAKQANVKTLLLSHLPQYGDQVQLVEEAQSIFTGETMLAEEGWIWGA